MASRRRGVVGVVLVGGPEVPLSPGWTRFKETGSSLSHPRREWKAIHVVFASFRPLARRAETKETTRTRLHEDPRGRWAAASFSESFVVRQRPLNLIVYNQFSLLPQSPLNHVYQRRYQWIWPHRTVSEPMRSLKTRPSEGTQTQEPSAVSTCIQQTARPSQRLVVT